MARRPNPEPEDWTYGDGCQCGCGKYPKGERSRFLPGHDLRLKSKDRTELETAARKAIDTLNDYLA